MSEPIIYVPFATHWTIYFPDATVTTYIYDPRTGTFVDTSTHAPSDPDPTPRTPTAPEDPKKCIECKRELCALDTYYGKHPRSARMCVDCRRKVGAP